MDIKNIDKNMKENIVTNHKQIRWIDVSTLPLRGLAFNNHYNRLDNSDYVSDKVEVLQRHSSGVNLTFSSNTQAIYIKARLASRSYMAHMTAVGQIGFDLYYKDQNQFIFIATTKVDKKEYEVCFVEGMERNERTFRLYFPLYMQVESVEIGINEGATFNAIKENQNRIVIYGTSISQGGCATRPGMSYSNILERMVNYEVINLGFSGSAHLELVMADIINKIPHHILILEVEANNSEEALHKNLKNFIDQCQSKRIFLISHFPYGLAKLKTDIKGMIQRNKALQKQMPHVIFIDGEKVLQKYGYDETVDGTHLTDLGFWELAKHLQEIIGRIDED